MAVSGAGALIALPATSAPRLDHRQRTDRARRLPAPSFPLVALAVVAFGTFLAEGATNDWSAVYLHGNLGASPGLAATGYTIFAVTMTVGRLFGDRAAARWGAVRLVRVATGVAAAGFALTLVIGDRAVGLVGFGLLGLGLATVVPLVLSSAARLGAAGPSLALVTSCGYTGLVAGPALIGGLAGAVGLPTALIVVVVVCVVTASLAGVLTDPSPDRRGDGPPAGPPIREGTLIP
ncbi:MAG: MFS transporter [Acidimicrobiales bacterium]